MLDSYIAQTQRLLQNPPSTNLLYATSDITTFINLARSQLAGEAECIRYYASLDFAIDERSKPFSAIDTGTSATNGIEGVLNIRQAAVVVLDGQSFVYQRPFEWFFIYRLSQVVPETGRPKTWAQFSQGVNGSVYIDPLPDGDYTLNLDTVCYPIPLVTDLTVEAIPYPWTDAVPFFAAYYAYMSAQRQQDAELMMKRYQEFSARARRMSTSSVLPGDYPQTVDVTMNNKLGIIPDGRR